MRDPPPFGALGEVRIGRDGLAGDREAIETVHDDAQMVTGLDALRATAEADQADGLTHEVTRLEWSTRRRTVNGTRRRTRRPDVRHP
jgi:hypothetical protein